MHQVDTLLNLSFRHYTNTILFTFAQWMDTSTFYRNISTTAFFKKKRWEILFIIYELCSTNLGPFESPSLVSAIKRLDKSAEAKWGWMEKIYRGSAVTIDPLRITKQEAKVTPYSHLFIFFSLFCFFVQTGVREYLIDLNMKRLFQSSSQKRSSNGSNKNKQKKIFENKYIIDTHEGKVWHKFNLFGENRRNADTV